MPLKLIEDVCVEEGVLVDVLEEEGVFDGLLDDETEGEGLTTPQSHRSSVASTSLPLPVIGSVKQRIPRPVSIGGGLNWP